MTGAIAYESPSGCAVAGLEHQCRQVIDIEASQIRREDAGGLDDV